MAVSDPWLRFIPKPPPLKGGQKWHVFLSYRSVHRPWLIQLYDVLRQAGYKVFLDQCVMPAGTILVRSLQEGLAQSAAGILVWSTASQDSDWCQREYVAMEARATTDKDYHYVAVAIDKASLPFLASQKIYIDFSDCREGPCGVGLVKLLYGMLGKPLPDEAVRLAAAIDDEVQHALAAIQGALNAGNCARLLELARSNSPAWTISALLGAKVAESLIRIKCHDEALRVLMDLEKRFPKAIRPKQLEGLALAKKGNWRKAQIILGELEAAGEQDPETLGIYARTWMDRYQETKDVKHLARSRDLYARAFDNAPDDYYTGINAASKSVLLGELRTAQKYVKKVERIVGKRKAEGDYWKTATIGEVQLVQRNYAKAAELYRAAVDMAPEGIGDHETTWLQAQRLMEVLRPSRSDYDRIAKVFKRGN